MITKWRESSTFKLVVMSLLVLNFQWLTGAVEGSLTDYATATSTLLLIWLGREWRTTHYRKGEDEHTG